MRDLRAAADFLQCFPRNLALMDPSRFQGAAVVGVLLSCDAAARSAHPSVVRNDGTGSPSPPRMHTVYMSEHMLRENLPLHIRVIPGLPLVARFAPVLDSRGRSRNPHSLLVVVQDRLFGWSAANDDASYSSSSGRATMPLNDFRELLSGGSGSTAIGTLVLHRADKKPLLCEHVVALEAFVVDMAERAADAQGQVGRDELAARLQPVDFAAFWLKFAERRGLGRGVVPPPSPFEM
ncbi:hypothetical protein VTK73DRAFT_10384 [Phialemonium thermophilum]|uniref:Uncharacterized protein n=1 Tax=Phialemonium thermophilum TaxID=223376 RepID=A0ABR3VX58_9PEZI